MLLRKTNRPGPGRQRYPGVSGSIHQLRTKFRFLNVMGSYPVTVKFSFMNISSPSSNSCYHPNQLLVTLPPCHVTLLSSHSFSSVFQPPWYLVSLLPTFRHSHTRDPYFKTVLMLFSQMLVSELSLKMPTTFPRSIPIT